MKKLSTLLLVFFVMMQASWAKDIYVKSTGNDDTNDGSSVETAVLTVNKAYALADYGDVIIVDGTVVITESFAISKSITLKGVNNGTIDAQSTTKHFNIALSDEDENPYFRMENISLINGNGEYNTPGSYNIGGSITIAGGTDAPIEIVDCVFDNNTTLNNGGAVAVDGGKVNFIGCHFTNNKTLGVLDDSNMGGAIALSQDADVMISSSTFENNTSTCDGGAIFYNSNNAVISLKIARSYFAGNTAQNNGGAIGFIANKNNSSSVEIINSTLYNNSADNNGGAISVASKGVGTLVLTNTTVYSNITTKSFGTAGGIRVNNASFPTTLNNSLVFDNYFPSGEDKIETDLQVTAAVTVNASIIGVVNVNEVDLYTIDDVSLVGNNNSGNNIKDKADLALMLDMEKKVVTFANDAVAVGLGKAEYLTADANGFIFDQLGNIRPATDGKIDVGAYQANGVEVTEPVAPEISSSNITANSFDISWTSATDLLKNYTIYLDDEFEAETSALSYQFSGLNPYQNYTVKVVATDVFDKSAEATKEVMTIDNVKPTFTGELLSSAIGENAFTVTWPVAVDNESGLKGYKVTLGEESIEVDASIQMHTFEELEVMTSYTVEVTAIDNADNESDGLALTVITIDETAPTIPTDVAVDQIESYSAVASWTASMDNHMVDHYIIKLGDQDIVTETAATTFKLEELSHSTTYKFTVSAVDVAGNISTPSTEVTFQTIIPVPSIPDGVSVDASETSAVVSWNASNHISSVSYVVMLGEEELEPTSETTLTLTELEENTDYAVKVKAIDESDVSSEYSTEVTFTTLYFAPEVPTSIAVSQVDNTSAVVTWDAVEHVLGVSYSVMLGDEEFETTSTTYTLTDLTPNTDYEVKVKTVDVNDMASDYSDAASFTTTYDAPTAPSNISVSDVMKTSAVVSWDALDHEVGVSYTVMLGNETFETSATTLTLSDLSENTAYEVKVKSVDVNDKTSDYSDAVGFTTDYSVPAAPQDVMVTEIEETTAKVTWTAVEHFFDVVYIVVLGDEEFETEDTSFMLSDLAEYTDYSVSVKVKDANEKYSEMSESKAFKTSYFAPETPSNIAISNVTTTSAEVSWDAVNHVVGVSYKVMLGDETFETSSTALTLSDLSENTAYEVKVKTVDVNDMISDDSDAVSFTTDYTAPSAPQNVTVSDIKETSATVTWEEVTHFFDVKYIVLLGDDEFETENTSFTLSDLAEYTDYTVSVKVKDANEKYSEMSESKTFKTSYFAPVAPSDILVSGVTPTSATVSWTAVSHALDVTYVITIDDKTLTTTSTSFVLEDLSEGTLYTFTVKTMNSEEVESEESEENSFTTGTTPPTSVDGALSELVKAFPNPSSSFMQIQLPQVMEGEYFISDLNGKKVQTGKINSNQFTLALPAGIYILNILSNDQYLIKKISFR
ncbi:fibronectin type III domain-containing protein [Flammeovirga sp. OC4]|uniref:fibronectin type III domain-containing protein n=1 Tax=Flammeovirga sp. OC4 TaxID=1382345 RepID=UPI0005C44D3C|nr:fibronectin type III domain-containing protein [Flammeovirga sp. OC4]